MKEATVMVKLSKDQESIKKHVTPIEAMILCAEHQANVKDVPVTVLKETITDVTTLVEKEVDNPHKPGSKRMDLVREKTTRTLDQELDRLRAIYGRVKVKALLSEVRDLPLEDFEGAIKRGMQITLPSSQLSQTKVI